MFDGPEGRDGMGFKWWLTREGHEPTFTMVYISQHALMGAASTPMTPRAQRAVETKGRSEVEAHLHMDRPPRTIEVRTHDDPIVTAVRD